MARASLANFATAPAVATIDAEEQANEDELSEERVEDLNKAFDNLVGSKTSSLDDLDYSSNDNNDNYFQEIKESPFHRVL